MREWGMDRGAWIGVGGAAVAGAVGYRMLVAGQLTVDTGVGRRLHELGPLIVDIDAPREIVFDLVAAPYLGRATRVMKAKVEVLERGSDMVVAAHRTPVGGGLVATTVESVRFDRPTTIDFRLLRGPVPHVVERFALHDDNGRTRFEYTGELGTDLWAVGAWWGQLVAQKWEATVEASVSEIRTEAERRARQ